MSEQLLTAVLQVYGPLGVFVLVAGWALKRLYDHNTEIQEKRIADAKATTEKLLQLVEGQHKSEELLARAIDGNADAVRELRQLLELADRRGQNRLAR